MIIYKIVNQINGKMYIGQTTHTLEWRKNRHLRAFKDGVDTHLYQAMRKHGIDNFKFEVICEVFDKRELNELETYYINKYDTIKHGYNMVDGGNNNIMFIDSVKKKHRIKMQSEETRKKISESMKQYRKEHGFSEEHRRKLSERAKGNHNFGNPDTRSVACYCVVDNKEYHFHNYLEAGKWWFNTYKPFPYSSCTYQRKIKQNIKYGYSTYGKEPNKIVIDNIKWYLEKEGDSNEKVD